MSRINKRFTSLQASGKSALIPYITAGDPQPSYTVKLMHNLVDAGADLLELGVPFSDPMADGPVIQAACERSLEYGTSLHDVLEMVKAFRQTDSETPVVLMGYLNPIECMGYEEFAKQAQTAGVDGVLTVDLPPEEATDFTGLLKSHEIDPVFLLSPTTTIERVKKISDAGSGFLYYVSLKGVTGAGHLDIPAVSDKLKMIRKVTDLPLGVGFGIRDAESAANVAQIADAVVVGSALVRIIENNHELDVIKQKMHALVAEMRQAMDQIRVQEAS
jgi:tryptophan synthase alpha chain